MRSNGLLKWLMIPVALLVLFVAIRLFSGGSTSAPPAADAGAKLTPEETGSAQVPVVELLRKITCEERVNATLQALAM